MVSIIPESRNRAITSRNKLTIFVDMKSRLRPFCLLALSVNAACTPGSLPGPQEATGPDGTVFQKMTVERLPELNAPRTAHHTLLLGDELTVIGGHTDGFKLIETVEYLRDGAWHEVPMYYPHDGGFIAPLPDGTVMVGGGSAEAFGVGQTLGVEVYDPISHSSRPIGIMSRKRAYASALPLPDGRVVVSGNWYADDDIEIWDPVQGFSFFKAVSQARTCPLILAAGPDEAVILGGRDPYGNPAEALVDRLCGETFRDPVLEEWYPVHEQRYADTDGKIGAYTYLLAATRRSDGEPGVLKVSGGDMSVLALERPLPRLGVDGHEIHWWGRLQVDRTRRQAWINGGEAGGRIYFARIGYDATFEGGPASMALFYAEHPDGVPFPVDVPVLLPGGRVALVGGKQPDPPVDDRVLAYNYITSRDGFIFHSEPPQRQKGNPWWALLAGALLLGGAALAAFLRRKQAVPEPGPEIQESGRPSQLSEQIMRLIEEEQLYKRKDLRLSDVATELATNKTYVSAMINNISGVKFSDLINGYRIRDALELMKSHPDMPLMDVADHCGFSSMTTFRRCFKAKTGKTPSEWRNDVDRTG